MTTIYHVCRSEWDGGDLLPLSDRMEWSDETADYIAANWPEVNPWAYYCGDGREIHCHATIETAREFAAEFGGQVLAIDAASLEVATGREYPHPVIRGVVPANLIRLA